MKRTNILKNTTVCLLIVSMSMFLFVGCKGKVEDNTVDQTFGGNPNSAFNREDIQNRMKENIQTLVTDGTITQTQADKVSEKLTVNSGGFGGGNIPQGNRPQGSTDRTPQGDTQGGAQSNPQDNTKRNPTGDNAQGNNQGNVKSRPQNNSLAELVTSGVITQAQSDVIMEKVMGNFQRPNN